MRNAAAALMVVAAVVVLVRFERAGLARRRVGSPQPAGWPQRRGGWPDGKAAVLLIAGGAGAAGATAGAVAGVLAAVSAAVLAHRWQQARAESRRAHRRAADVELLAALTAELRAGRQSGAALAAVEAVADSGLRATWAGARAVAVAGGDVAAALRAGAEEGGMLARLAAAWQVSAAAGTPLADVVDRVEAELRALTALHLKADVELAGARATGGLLALLPVLGVGLGQAMGAQPAHVLLHTPAGAVCAAGGLVLELVGLTWVGRLTGHAVGRLP